MFMSIRKVRLVYSSAKNSLLNVLDTYLVSSDVIQFVHLIISLQIASSYGIKVTSP